MKESPYFEALEMLLTFPQLRGLLDSLFDEKFACMLAVLSKAHKQPKEADYFTTKQALEFVHLSKPTLNKLRREGRITALNSSTKRVLYKRSDLVAYLEATKQQKGGGHV